jgi:hypothetical protein
VLFRNVVHERRVPLQRVSNVGERCVHRSDGLLRRWLRRQHVLFGQWHAVRERMLRNRHLPVGNERLRRMPSGRHELHLRRQRVLQPFVLQVRRHLLPILAGRVQRVVGLLRLPSSLHVEQVLQELLHELHDQRRVLLGHLRHDGPLRMHPARRGVYGWRERLLLRIDVHGWQVLRADERYL